MPQDDATVCTSTDRRCLEPTGQSLRPLNRIFFIQCIWCSSPLAEERRTWFWQVRMRSFSLKKCGVPTVGSFWKQQDQDHVRESNSVSSCLISSVSL